MIEAIQDRLDSSGMVAVGADPCVCPQRRQATIIADSQTMLCDEATNRSLQKSYNKTDINRQVLHLYRNEFEKKAEGKQELTNIPYVC